jgi:hypothetical protein
MLLVLYFLIKIALAVWSSHGLCMFQGWFFSSSVKKCHWLWIMMNLNCFCSNDTLIILIISIKNMGCFAIFSCLQFLSSIFNNFYCRTISFSITCIPNQIRTQPEKKTITNFLDKHWCKNHQWNLYTPNLISHDKDYTSHSSWIWVSSRMQVCFNMYKQRSII